MKSGQGNKRKKPKKKPKTTVDVVHGIRIREPRPDVFIVQVRREGFQLYEKFGSLEAARGRCEQIHIEREQHGLSAFELPPRSRKDAKEALDLLAGRISLTEAAEYWLQRNPDGESILINIVIDEYLADMARKKRSRPTIANVRWRLKKFANDHGNRPIASLTDQEIQDWIDAHTSSPRNAINFRGALRSLFRYALKRRYIRHDPTEHIETPTPATRMPHVWPPARVASLLLAAQTFRQDMIPLLVTMAFAGLRPEEAMRLDWKSVRLDDRLIRILPETSKTRDPRVIDDLPDNLIAWLSPYKKSTGPLAPPRSTVLRWRRRLSSASLLGIDSVLNRLAQHEKKKGTEIKELRLGWDAIIEDAKEKDNLWHPDILRHSFATYWLATHSDINRLAEMMGNSPNIIKAHYKGLASKKEAEAYWKITPDSVKRTAPQKHSKVPGASKKPVGRPPIEVHIKDIQ